MLWLLADHAFSACALNIELTSQPQKVGVNVTDQWHGSNELPFYLNEKQLALCKLHDIIDIDSRGRTIYDG